MRTWVPDYSQQSSSDYTAATGESSSKDQAHFVTFSSFQDLLGHCRLSQLLEKYFLGTFGLRWRESIKDFISSAEISSYFQDSAKFYSSHWARTLELFPNTGGPGPQTNLSPHFSEALGPV